MPDAERLDPPLLPERQRDEEPEFDQLGNREVPVEILPEGVVRNLCVPDDGAGVGEGDLLPLGELVRVGEVQQLVVFLFGQSLPSSLDGALDPSVFAIDGFGDVDPAEFLDVVVKDAVAKCQTPRLREGPEDVGVVCADRLALRPGRPFPAAPFQLFKHRRILYGCRVDITDTLLGHDRASSLTEAKHELLTVRNAVSISRMTHKGPQCQRGGGSRKKRIY